MSLPCFIGDEVSATAWRLAGLQVHVPRDEELLTTVQRTCEQASLVLVSAAIAQQLPAAELDALLARVTPPVIVIPDLTGRTPVPDLAIRVRRQLGVLE